MKYLHLFPFIVHFYFAMTGYKSVNYEDDVVFLDTINDVVYYDESSDEEEIKDRIYVVVSIDQTSPIPHTGNEFDLVQRGIVFATRDEEFEDIFYNLRDKHNLEGEDNAILGLECADYWVLLSYDSIDISRSDRYCQVIISNDIKNSECKIEKVYGYTNNPLHQGSKEIFNSFLKQEGSRHHLRNLSPKTLRKDLASKHFVDYYDWNSILYSKDDFEPILEKCKCHKTTYKSVY